MGYIEETSGLIVFVLVLLIVALAIVMRSVYRGRTRQRETATQKSPNSSRQLTISDACEQVFRDTDNGPLTLNDLHGELSKRNTICSKAALEFILLDELLKFSVDHSGKGTRYRLNSTYLDQNP